jgi:hypothetical protein
MSAINPASFITPTSTLAQPLPYRGTAGGRESPSRRGLDVGFGPSSPTGYDDGYDCRYHTSIHIKQSRLLILKLGWECLGMEWVAVLRSIRSHHMLANRTKCSIQQRQHSRQSRTDNLGMEAQTILQPMLIGLVGSVVCHLALEPSTFKISTSTSTSDTLE